MARDTIAFSSDHPWAGIGADLGPGATIDKWRTAAGLDWTVAMSPVKFDIGGQEHPYRRKTVLYREDTGAPLSIVSAKYQPVQPPDVLGFFREQVEGLGTFRIHTAGTLDGGRKIWALARAGEELRLGKEDVVGRFSLLATSYDRSVPTIFQQTSICVLCQNTLMAAVHLGAAGHEQQMRWRHNTPFAPDKLKRAMILDKEWSRFVEAAGFLAMRKIPSRKAAREYFGRVFFPSPHKEDFSAKAASRRLDRMMDVYEGAPGQQDKARRGTAWGLLNAVTYFVDHEAGARTPEARLDRAWFGDGRRIKERAFEFAVSLN